MTERHGSRKPERWFNFQPAANIGLMPMTTTGRMWRSNTQTTHKHAQQPSSNGAQQADADSHAQHTPVGWRLFGPGTAGSTQHTSRHNRAWCWSAWRDLDRTTDRLGRQRPALTSHKARTDAYCDSNAAPGQPAF